MGWTSWLRRRGDVLFRKNDIDRELDDEMRFHVEMEIREHIKSGHSPEEARRLAMVSFGGVERFKEEVRDARGGRLIDDVVQDLRTAVRSLFGQPALLFTATLTLGLGIGGGTAMYGVLQSSLFAALPFPEAESLVTGRSTMNDGAKLGPMLSGFDFVDYRAESNTLESVAAIAPFPQRRTLTGMGAAQRVDVVEVSWNFFETLGTDPVAGRGFSANAESESAGRVAMISEGYWSRGFGGDPSIVGRTLQIDGAPVTIVGIAPVHARFSVDADVWVPMRPGQGMAGSRRAHNYLMIARLRPGTSLSTAQSDMDAISRRLEEAYPDSNDGKGILLTPARDMLVEGYRSTLILLVGAVVLLLVVACMNVAGLLLARGASRAAELTVRSVLGASRGRLLRQLLTESLVLATLAGVVGVVVAVFGRAGILAYVQFDRLGSVASSPGWTTPLFAVLLSVGTVTVFGLIPALQASGQRDASTVLRGGRRVSGDPGTARLRSAAVVLQVAMSVALISLSGLLLRSADELRSVDLGFDPENLLTAEVSFPEHYDATRREAYLEEVRRVGAGLGGVRDVAAASQLPIRNPGNNWGIGRGDGDESAFLAHQRTVAPGYFEMLGMQIVAGRDLEPADRDAAPASIVLGERTAERLFGEESPLGQVVHVQGSRSGQDRPHLVVGVVSDARLDDPSVSPPPAMYYSFEARTPRRMYLAFRLEGEVGSVAAELRRRIGALDPNIPLDGIETMEAIVERRTAAPRALALLVAVFGLTAIVMVSVGLYGVTAYQVSQRTREIGVRMALGASFSSVSGAVVKRAGRLVLVGLILGIPGALVGARFLERMLFGVRGADPLTYAGVVAVLGLVTVAACLVPARKAAGIDPVQALRAE